MASRVALASATVALLISAGCGMASAESYYNPPRVDPGFPNHQPPYPETAQLNGEQGVVILDVYVRSNGRPGKIKINQSSGFYDLDTAALEGVLNWRFLPATRGGDTVSDWTPVKIVYQLPNLVPAAASTPAH